MKNKLEYQTPHKLAKNILLNGRLNYPLIKQLCSHELFEFFKYYNKGLLDLRLSKRQIEILEEHEERKLDEEFLDGSTAPLSRM